MFDVGSIKQRMTDMDCKRVTIKSIATALNFLVSVSYALSYHVVSYCYVVTGATVLLMHKPPVVLIKTCSLRRSIIRPGLTSTTTT